ncbi:hypothetical protein PCCS19_38630 [Paenibacillus sp. CCS19]|uniref:hypothetical protein n=1 Tax=Paenibacillus sp. CCS19 TaxID=3158387 RepID=UPI0025629AAD|nr:hypothetical protein [Paenibacillus cellulosilyticus]GMK40807.1 hypothetical protein PCCS19_38630 [Paenibacillus cellulosilyticus]
MPSSAYWYLGLSLISLLLLTFTMVRAKNIRVVFLFLMMTEAAYLIETVIYIWGSSYMYHPGILKNSAFYDSNMGALTSNLLVIPTAAVMIAVFQWGWKRIAALIIVIGCIEWLFVKLEIYTLFWWRIEYTVVGLMFYLPLAPLLYARLRRPVTGKLHALFLFLCAGPVLGTLHILPIMLFMNRSYDLDWFRDSSQSTTAFSSVYYLVMACIIVVMMKLQIWRVWMKCLVISVFIFVLTKGLIAVGVLHVHVWWDPWYYSLFPPAVFLLFIPISNRMARSM